MYKIYINGTPLFLCSAEEVGNQPAADSDKLVARYTGNPKMLLNYLDMLEKNTSFESVTLYTSQADSLFEDFASQFRLIEAAGGIVYNQKGEVLLIYRRDHWDLPKGKIDKGEGRAEAALREVREETGLKTVALGEYLGVTYHTYRDKKNKRILKPTYWYRMSSQQEDLHPQAEEDILRAEWRAVGPFLDARPIVYGNIKDLLEAERAEKP